MGSAIKSLQAAGKEVIVVGPAPSAGEDNSACVERLLTGALMINAPVRCEMGRAAYDAGAASIDAFLGRLNHMFGVRIVQLRDALCDAQVCHTVIDGVPVYRDSWHLSYPGSEKVFEILARKGVTW